jgi:hypothetical protein
MSSPAAKITDHIDQIKAVLLGQFKRDPPLLQLVEALGLEVQRLEDVCHDVLTKRLLDQAVGDILDQLGDVVRVSRLGRTDTEYRRIIQVAIAANDSDGGAAQIVWIASQLVGEDVRYVREGTARLRLEYTTSQTLTEAYLAEAMDLIGRSISAGVAWTLVVNDTSDGARYDVSTYGAGRYAHVVGGS